MVTKLVSLSAAITMLDIAVRSRYDASAPLYYFISSQLWVNLFMIMLVGFCVAISFKRRRSFKNWYSYAGCMTAALALILLGGLGTFFSNFILDGWNLMLPLNYVMLLECGIVLAISGLSYRHAKRPASVSQLVSRLLATPKKPALAAASGFRVAYQAVRSSGIVRPMATQR